MKLKYSGYGGIDLVISRSFHDVFFAQIHRLLTKGISDFQFLSEVDGKLAKRRVDLCETPLVFRVSDTDDNTFTTEGSKMVLTLDRSTLEYLSVVADQYLDGGNVSPEIVELSVEGWKRPAQLCFVIDPDVPEV